MSIDRWVLLCLVCLTTFFVDNSVLVPDIMESGNIVTAREMVYDGNWIAPTMNGELRLEKPPLWQAWQPSFWCSTFIVL